MAALLALAARNRLLKPIMTFFASVLQWTNILIVRITLMAIFATGHWGCN